MLTPYGYGYGIRQSPSAHQGNVSIQSPPALSCFCLDVAAGTPCIPSVRTIGHETKRTSETSGLLFSFLLTTAGTSLLLYLMTGSMRTGCKPAHEQQVFGRDMVDQARYNTVNKRAAHGGTSFFSCVPCSHACNKSLSFIGTRVAHTIHSLLAPG